MLKNIEEIKMKREKLDKILVRRGNKLDDMVKEAGIPISVVLDCSIRLSRHVLA